MGRPEGRDSTVATTTLYKTVEEAEAAVRSIEGHCVDVTGDACAGDEVAFARATFSGSYRKPRFEGYEVVVGKIVKESYGKMKQQHTFTIMTDDRRRILIKGRNLYSVLVLAKPRDPEERAVALRDKHDRGDQARKDRQKRLYGDDPWLCVDEY